MLYRLRLMDFVSTFYRHVSMILNEQSAQLTEAIAVTQSNAGEWHTDTWEVKIIQRDLQKKTSI